MHTFLVLSAPLFAAAELFGPSSLSALEQASLVGGGSYLLRIVRIVVAADLWCA